MIPASTCSISSFPHSYTSLYRRIILEYLSFLRWAAVCILYPIAHLPVQPFCRILIDCLLLFGGGPNLFARLPVGAFHHTVTVVVNYRVGTKIAATIGAAAQRDFIGTEHLKLPYVQCGQLIRGHIGMALQRFLCWNSIYPAVIPVYFVVPEDIKTGRKGPITLSIATIPQKYAVLPVIFVHHIESRPKLDRYPASRISLTF